MNDGVFLLSHVVSNQFLISNPSPYDIYTHVAKLGEITILYSELGEMAGKTLVIDREAREIMYLVASVRLSVCPSGCTQGTL